VSLRVANVLAGLVLVIIAVLSLLNLKSADYYTDDRYHEAQTVWFIVGFIVLFVTSRLELALIQRLTLPLTIATLLVLFLTLLIGKDVNHARRWIEVFGVTFQASEVAKMSTLLMVASYLDQRRANDALRWRHLARPLTVVALTVGLIVVQPDLGTALIVAGLFLAMLLYDGLSGRSVLKLLVIVAVAAPLLWNSGMIKEYQKDRVRLWVHTDPQELQKVDKRLFDKYMQPKQALWAVGSGGLMGRGIHEGAKTRLRYLYAIHTDFALATFAEEHGFVGLALLLGLYFYLVAWTWLVSTRARDRFGALVCFGSGLLIAVQAWVNLGMIVGLAPVVGITFPLMSYGGSSLLIKLFSLGLVYNVARNAEAP
jgi:rod shape determining protein RodA